MTLTLKQAQADCRTIGMTLTSTMSQHGGKEYRVNFKGEREATAYYTNFHDRRKAAEKLVAAIAKAVK